MTARCRRKQKNGGVVNHFFVFKVALLSAAFVIAGSMFLSVPIAATLQSLQVGMEAPDFNLKNLSGENKAFSDVRGEKLTVLVFWSTWSPKSEQVLMKMEQLHEKYKDKGISVVAVNVDNQVITDQTMAEIKAKIDTLKLSYPVFIDHGLVTFHEFGVIAIPSTIILDAGRTITYELSGFPLVGSEEMTDFIAATIEGKKPEAVAEQKKGYQPDKNALRLYNMGRQALKSRRMADTAEMWFKKAVEADPKFVIPHLSLGKFYQDRNNMPMAKEQFELAISKDRDNVIALCELGMLHVREGKIGEGSVLIEKALKFEESYTPCYYYLGYIYSKEGNMQKAYKMFETAERLNPSDYEIYIYKGKACEENKKMQEAADAYKRALDVILKH